MTDLYNIRLKVDASPFHKGECVKAYISSATGTAHPWSAGHVVLYADEYEIVIPDRTFAELLEGGKHSAN